MTEQTQQPQLKTNHNVRIVTRYWRNVLCLFGEIRTEEEQKADGISSSLSLHFGSWHRK